MTLLKAENLSKVYPPKIRALSHVSLEISKGEILGVVGESGCGKSTLGRCLLYLEEPTSGEVFFQGNPLSLMTKKERLGFKRKAQIIFQDPYASLDPRMTTFNLIAEPLRIHGIGDVENIVHTLLDLVGLSAEMQNRFPHEFSGGQRQRIGIARALALQPELIVCDEPISALDVSIQAQIVNLLKSLQEKLGLTLIFIAHDLAMIRYISDRVAVMYLGHLVELTTSEELYTHPLHPYTQALLSAIPIPDPKIRKQSKLLLASEIPSPSTIGPGCPFASRCPHAMPLCKEKNPPLQLQASGHKVACHLY